MDLTLGAPLTQPALDERRAATTIVNWAIATIAVTLAARTGLAELDGSAAGGLGLAALWLVIDAVRAGVPVRWAIVGAATFFAALPHADLTSSAVVTTLGMTGAITLRQRPILAGFLAGLALATHRPDAILALLVGIGLPWRAALSFAAVALLGGAAVGGVPSGSSLLGVWPWRCVPRRLGTAIPLASVALGLFGLTRAVRPRETAPVAIGRLIPLGAGIVVAWLGTYHPPRPPLYNAPSGLAMWGLTAALVGTAIHVARTRPSTALQMAVALGVGGLVVTGLRTVPVGSGAACGQLLASPAVLWLLAMGLVHLVRDLCTEVIHPWMPRVVDALLVLQLIWLAGFVHR